MMLTVATIVVWLHAVSEVEGVDQVEPNPELNECIIDAIMTYMSNMTYMVM